MTFDDLPKNFRDLPLDDPILRADVVDLFVGYVDRAEGCLAILLLDDEHRCVQPVLITELGPADPTTLGSPIRVMLDELRPPAVVAALGRQGSPLFTDTDRSCHQVLVEVCREVGVDLVAAYVATEHAVRELPEHLRLAS
ncbi:MULTISPECIES: hypothetical protein [unclassified Knoellia]|uniref:hypothetical protein n=1 Tax=Knoellia altitudinis TaxID=3404795 RepID=UPI00361AAD86